MVADGEIDHSIIRISFNANKTIAFVISINMTAFRRTRHKVNEGVLDDDVVTRFDNDLVIRYVDKVIIEPNGYEVYFKAGIVITV